MECSDFSRYSEVRGALKAYEEMATLPEVITQTEDRLRDSTERIERSTRDAAAERTASRFGSRWFIPGT